MGRRPLAGRDTKISQGHRRDAFFAKMRRKGGVPRVANQAPALAAEVEDTAALTEADSATEVDGAEPEAVSSEDQRDEAASAAP